MQGTGQNYVCPPWRSWSGKGVHMVPHVLVPVVKSRRSSARSLIIIMSVAFGMGKVWH
jgi:hypothetical protein